MNDHAINKEEFFDKLKKLNTGRIGSFGEYIFEQQCKNNGIDVKRYFKERTDFIVGIEKKRIDVKTSRIFINNSFKQYFSYKGTILEDIEYVCVNFYADFVTISVNSHPFFGNDNNSKLDYSLMPELFENWKIYRKKTNLLNKTVKGEYTKEIKEVKEKINTFFKDKGYRTHIIYRTCQKEFGKESPDNLLPYIIRNKIDIINPEEKTVRVFIDYNNPTIWDDNIFQIIAYLETDHGELPRLDVVHVNGGKKERNKVDLDKIAAKFVFLSIADLLSDNYKKMFK